MALGMKPIAIPRISGMDNRTFTEQYRNKRPVILSHIIIKWIPMDKWTSEYLQGALRQDYDDKLQVFVSKDNTQFINHPDFTSIVTMTSAEFMAHVSNGEDDGCHDDDDAERAKTRYYLRTMSMPKTLQGDVETPKQVESLLSVISSSPSAVETSEHLTGKEIRTQELISLNGDLGANACLNKHVNINKVAGSSKGEAEVSAWEDLFSPLSLKSDADTSGDIIEVNGVSSSGNEASHHLDAQPRVFNADTMQLWIGTRGNITPLHYDRNHGLLTQIVGRKELVLYSHEDTTFVYPYPGHSDRAHTSRVNLRLMGDAAYAKKFPKWEEAQPYTCVLQPGELLYTPPFWWHDVTSLDNCVSVTLPWDIDGYEEFPLSMLR